jgi:hypothetical protein
MKEGAKLIGYGMATATYPANRSAPWLSAAIFPMGEDSWAAGH